MQCKISNNGVPDNCIKYVCITYLVHSSAPEYELSMPDCMTHSFVKASSMVYLKRGGLGFYLYTSYLNGGYVLLRVG